MSKFACMVLDGRLRQCCTECAERCRRVGLLRELVTLADGEIVVYYVVDGHTLEDCRRFIQQRGCSHEQRNDDPDYP